jgi:uncharacterized protein (DUF305 family)
MMASRRSFVLALAASAAPSGTRGQHAHNPAPDPELLSEFGAEMHRQMTSMMDAMNSAPMTGDADRDFLAMMIPHHQGAVEMARLVLLHGRDPLTRQLAEEIIASQVAEISSMQNRVALLEARVGTGPETFPHLSGTRGQ